MAGSPDVALIIHAGLILDKKFLPEPINTVRRHMELAGGMLRTFKVPR
jgi:hypothetical protein